MNELQECILDIYKNIKKICDEYDIRYYAIGGTSIGAVRHNGFIPWDDDIDIAMPDEDYFRFIEVASRELPDNFEVVTCENNDSYNEIFLKVVDKNTTFIDEYYKDDPDNYSGVWIDVMPLFGIENDSSFFNQVRHDLNMTILMSMSKDEISKRGFAKKLAWGLAAPLRASRNGNYYARKQINYLKQFKFKTHDLTGYTWSSRVEMLCFPTSWFSGYEDVKFEDTTMRCASGNHEMLTQMFGDYMVIPDEVDQVVHDGFIDLNNSYKEYQNGNLTFEIKE